LPVSGIFEGIIKKLMPRTPVQAPMSPKIAEKPSK